MQPIETSWIFYDMPNMCLQGVGQCSPLKPHRFVCFYKTGSLQGVGQCSPLKLELLVSYVPWFTGSWAMQPIETSSIPLKNRNEFTGSWAMQPIET